MSIRPDVKNYSIDELYDSQRAVDRDTYPDIAQTIDDEIELRLSSPEFAEATAKKAAMVKYRTGLLRIIAAIIDGFIVVFVSRFLNYLATYSGAFGAIALEYVDVAQYSLYAIVLHGLCGQTIGKMMLSVKVADHKTEKSITFKQALLRDFVSILVLLLNVIMLTAIYVFGVNSLAAWVVTSLLAFTGILFVWWLLELITMLTNEKRRSLPDYIAGTVVVRI